MREVNCFSADHQPGDIAEKYLRETYFPSIGLGFRKIETEGKPDGYILSPQGGNIALTEIKLIIFKCGGSDFRIITLDETIREALNKAKKQLRREETELPRIVYLIGDNSFFKDEVVRSAIFGKYVTVFNESGVVSGGHRGFRSRYREDNKFRDNLLTAIICYLPTMEGYDIWIYRNENAVGLPVELFDTRHVKKTWVYNANAPNGMADYLRPT